MIVSFDKAYLQELYETGKTQSKKHRFQPEIARKYVRCIDLLIEVPDIEALYKYNSLNIEALKGDKSGLFSVRVNNQYRIEFSVNQIQNETIVNLCTIIELSNHYK